MGLLITRILEQERKNFWLWIPVFFGFGAVFYFSYPQNFLSKLPIFIALFCCAAILFRNLICAACLCFLLGSFYGIFYEKFFLNHTEISGKIYADITGKVVEIKKFYNPVNHLKGLNLVIAEPVLYRTKFDNKIVKKKKPKKISDKKIIKDFVNLENYQEVDRKFLDYAKNYQNVDWNDDGKFPNPPQKISINLVKNSAPIAINDEIALRALLQPPKPKDFPEDFDFARDAKMKKIGAYGFAIGEAKILRQGEISNFDQWFLALREKIRARISTSLKDDEAAIATALLIGDQSQISKETLAKIRNSGLAHLLSISGFHLSLAGAIFFIATRFLLSRSEYLALNFDLKKIASVIAIFATYFYLKIAGSPLPAQRAFLMVVLVLLALFLDEKNQRVRIAAKDS